MLLYIVAAADADKPYSWGEKVSGRKKVQQRIGRNESGGLNKGD